MLDPVKITPQEALLRLATTLTNLIAMLDAVRVAAEQAAHAINALGIYLSDEPATHSAEFAPDVENGLSASETIPPVSSIRKKEVARTCLEWAHDEQSWTLYKRALAKQTDDHPAKGMSASELERYRVDFIADPATCADATKYARPGFKFTAWLRRRVS